jgi:pimeloyl-ACP methyl ester carboxylesterase
MTISFTKTITSIGLLLLVLFTSECRNTSGEKQNEPDQGVLTFSTLPPVNKGDIRVHYYIPAGKIREMPLQFIMHGAGRNADDYIEGWKTKADAYEVILVAPELTKESFSSSEYYNGMFLTPEGEISDPEATTFSLIDRIFEFVREELQLENSNYNIYGHSAGGQFTHRFMLFYDSPYVKRAVAANAGWYTFPDDAAEYPYGIKGLFSDSDSLRKAFYSEDITVLLGTADTIRDKDLRQTPEADLQGLTRLARGERFFEYNKAMAENKGHLFLWQKVYVQASGHDHTLMSPAAADILYGEGNGKNFK